MTTLTMERFDEEAEVVLVLLDDLVHAIHCMDSRSASVHRLGDPAWPFSDSLKNQRILRRFLEGAWEESMVCHVTHVGAASKRPCDDFLRVFDERTGETAFEAGVENQGLPMGKRPLIPMPIHVVGRGVVARISTRIGEVSVSYKSAGVVIGGNAGHWLIHGIYFENRNALAPGTPPLSGGTLSAPVFIATPATFYDVSMDVSYVGPNAQGEPFYALIAWPGTANIGRVFLRDSQKPF